MCFPQVLRTRRQLVFYNKEVDRLLKLLSNQPLFENQKNCLEILKQASDLLLLRMHFERNLFRQFSQVINADVILSTQKSIADVFVNNENSLGNVIGRTGRRQVIGEFGMELIESLMPHVRDQGSVLLRESPFLSWEQKQRLKIMPPVVLMNEDVFEHNENDADGSGTFMTGPSRSTGDFQSELHDSRGIVVSPIAQRPTRMADTFGELQVDAASSECSGGSELVAVKKITEDLFLDGMEMGVRFIVPGVHSYRIRGRVEERSVSCAERVRKKKWKFQAGVEEDLREWFGRQQETVFSGSVEKMRVGTYGKMSCGRLVCICCFEMAGKASERYLLRMRQGAEKDEIEANTTPICPTTRNTGSNGGDEDGIKTMCHLCPSNETWLDTDILREARHANEHFISGSHIPPCALNCDSGGLEVVSFPFAFGAGRCETDDIVAKECQLKTIGTFLQTNSASAVCVSCRRLDYVNDKLRHSESLCCNCCKSIGCTGVSRLLKQCVLCELIAH